MALDLEGIAPAARARYVGMGRNYGSLGTLAQANRTLEGLATHGARLAEAGFAPEDAEELREARDALIAAGVGRDTKKTGRKQTNRAFVAAMKSAKATRLRGRAIAQRVEEVLAKRGDAASMAAAERVGSALELTSVVRRDAELVSRQLDILRDLFADPAVAATAAVRGGPKFVADAAAKSEALRALSSVRSGGAGTPGETELLDLLDGIIVHLARSARRAARAVATEAGEPALAALFELDHLDRDTPSTTPTAPAPASA